MVFTHTYMCVITFLLWNDETSLNNAGMFADKKWLPLQPPIHFPSTEYETEYDTKAPEVSKQLPSHSSGHDEL